MPPLKLKYGYYVHNVDYANEILSTPRVSAATINGAITAASCPAKRVTAITIPVNAGAMHTILVRNPGVSPDKNKLASDKNATAQPEVEQVIKEHANKKAATPRQPEEQDLKTLL